MTTLVSALSVARERELGTLEQLLVTPLLPTEIIFGKAVPALMVGMLEANIVLTAALLFFHLPFTGNLALLEAALMLFNLAALGLGLAISAVSFTQRQAMLGVLLSPPRPSSFPAMPRPRKTCRLSWCCSKAGPWRC